MNFHKNAALDEPASARSKSLASSPWELVYEFSQKEILKMNLQFILLCPGDPNKEKHLLQVLLVARKPLFPLSLSSIFQMSIGTLGPI